VKVLSAEFVKTATRRPEWPPGGLPELAFVGRSNVGKSSMLNALAGRSGLARVSGTPGRTQALQFFELRVEPAGAASPLRLRFCDLPGYGYARVSQKTREQWDKLFTSYVTLRENLILLFVLVDARHEPMASDLAFMERLALNGVPFARVFTKSDKLSAAEAEKNRAEHDRVMLRTWESLPPTFVTSAARGTGRDELLDYINSNMIFFTGRK
jgi:GTP-binding protein